MLYKVLKASRGYFLADIMIWLIAHNLPLLIGVYIKEYFDSKNPLMIVFWITLLIAVRVVFIAVGARVDIRAQQHWAKSFYLTAYDSIQNGTVDLEADNGQLLNSLNEDVSSIISTISYAIDTACNVIYGIAAVCILLTIHIPLTILILCLPLLAITINSFIKKRVVKYSEKIKKMSSSFSSELNYLIQDSRIIRVNHLEESVQDKVEKVISSQRKIGFRLASWWGVLGSVTNMITECNILVILLVYMQSDILSAGSVILFITYSFDLGAMSQYISALILTIQNTKVYMKNFENKFCSGKKEPAKSSQASRTAAVAADMKEGEVNVLIGGNASGKSTCFRELFHTLPDSVMLPDKYHIFNTTIQENISLGFAEKDSAVTADIAAMACLDMDLDHVCENNISGGQEFRIVLARSIFHSKNCLLIDNNLTSIDEKTRREILNHLIALHKTIVLTDHIDRDLYKGLKHIYIS